MEKWFTASELAHAKLPGLPATERGILKRATSNSWPSRPREKSGGGKEYPASALPPKARKALTRALVAAPSTALAVAEPKALVPDARFVKDWQKDAQVARALILAHLDTVKLEHGVSQSQAIEAMVALAESKMLPPALMDAIAVANQRGGTNRTLSRPTLYRWIKERNEAGSALALTPKTAKEKTDYPWANAFMKLYLRPTSPSVSACLAELKKNGTLPIGVEMPTSQSVHRFLKKLSFFQKNKGRIGPKEMRSHKAYVARDVSDLEAGMIYIGDGHTFKALVPHPAHGRPFRPEVTTILDVGTRKAMGFSVDLAENTWAVAGALRQALMTSVCCLFYYDNGKGANNETWDDPALGLMAQIGITKINSLPGNSQARGIIERFHSSVLHRAAKWLPSYVGPDMDPDARFQQDRKLRKDIKETGTSDILIPWADFVVWLQDVMDDYNNRPHSSLPKMRDPETGKMRHMTPNERWNESVANGAQLFPLTEEEAAYLFRPYVMRKASRGIVRLFDQEYFNRTLERYEEQDVQVGYDIHDGSRVFVNDSEGRFICEAICNGNRRGYVPQSALDVANKKRVDGQVKRASRHVEIAEEGRSQKVIEYRPEQPFDPEIMRRGETVLARIVDAENVIELPLNARPKFTQDDGEMALWLIGHPDQITDSDRKYFLQKLRDFNFGLLLKSYQIDPEYLKNVMLKKEIA